MSQDSKCCQQASVSCLSMVSVDERGQMVVPKEIRTRAGLKAGDKLAVMSMEKDGQICCICLVAADQLLDLIRDKLGPVMTAVFAGGGK